MTSSEKITISVLKADIGSLVGNSTIPEIFEETASDILDKYKGEKIFDYFVSHVGDDLNLIILHNKGEIIEKYIKSLLIYLRKIQKLQKK